MIYLALSILCSALLGFIFRLFPKYGIDQVQAIVVNYATTLVCATTHKGQFPIQKSNFEEAWWPIALILGLIFVTGFNGAAATIRHFGVTVGAVVQKMSIALSVPFAILVYGESAGLLKILGIVAALASIVLSSLPATQPVENQKVNSQNLLWIPILTFLLSVAIEVGFLVVNHGKMLPDGDVRFICTIFATAGLLGLIFVLSGFWSGKMRFEWKNVLAGIALGIPNYGSLLFIFLALGSGMEGSRFFPLNNVGIIVASAVGAVVLFREKLSGLNWLGVALAITAILLISG